MLHTQDLLFFFFLFKNNPYPILRWEQRWWWERLTKTEYDREQWTFSERFSDRSKTMKDVNQELHLTLFSLVPKNFIPNSLRGTSLFQPLSDGLVIYHLPRYLTIWDYEFFGFNSVQRKMQISICRLTFSKIELSWTVTSEELIALSYWKRILQKKS